MDPILVRNRSFQSKTCLIAKSFEEMHIVNQRKVHKRLKHLRPKIKWSPKTKKSPEVTHVCPESNDNVRNESMLEDIRLSESASKLWKEYTQLKETENARDKLLKTLSQNNNTDVDEFKIREEAFKTTSQNSSAILEQLKSFMRMFIDLAENDQSLIEVSFRIIEEEERRDEEANLYYKEYGFSTPERPKAWKKNCMVELKRIPLLRFGIDLRTENLKDHLRNLRIVIAQDLCTIQNLVDNSDLLHEDIFNYFVEEYRDNLCKHIRDIVLKGLEKYEVTIILLFIRSCRNDFPENEFEGFWKTNENGKSIFDIVPEDTHETLRKRYISITDTFIQEVFSNALKRDQQDWYGDALPNMNSEMYHTYFPRDITALVAENLDLSADIGPDAHRAIHATCLSGLSNIISVYAKEVKEYISPMKSSLKRTPKKLESLTRSIGARKENPYDGSLKPPHHLEYCIALMNNFHSISRHLDDISKKCLCKHGETNFHDLRPMVDELSKHCLSIFMNKVLIQAMKVNLEYIFSKNWFDDIGSASIMSVTDYIISHSYKLVDEFLIEWADEVATEIENRYFENAKKSKFHCKNEGQRCKLAEKLNDEITQIETTLKSIAKEPLHQSNEGYFVNLKQMVDLLKLSDKSAIRTSLLIFRQRHPNGNCSHLKHSLEVHGGIKKSKIHDLIHDVYRNDERK